ncbi:MAG: hypothetical protein ACRYFE_08475 [Janthinobacterium lividum]
MSVDEFDPAIEREYRVLPSMSDSSLFQADMEMRIHKRSLRRRLFIGLAGLVGLFFFIREIIGLRFIFALQDKPEAELVRRQVGEVMGMLRQTATNLGLDDVGLGALDGPQLLILISIALTALLAGAAIRLSQSL